MTCSFTVSVVTGRFQFPHLFLQVAHALSQRGLQAVEALPDGGAFDAELSRIQADEPEGALNVVPRDPNWDLKRDLEPRAEVLRKRTQRAIVEILRERLKAEARQ